MKRLNKSASILGSFLIAQLLFGQKGTPSNAEMIWKKAKTARYEQNWAEAVVLYEEIINKHKNYNKIAEAQFWYAVALEQENRWAQAAKAYSLFIEKYSEHRILTKEAKLNRNRCWGSIQDISSDALTGLRDTLKDDELEIRFSAAMQLARRGRRDGAEVLKEALNTDKLSALALNSLKLLNIEVPMLGNPNRRSIRLLITEKGQKTPIVIKLPAGSIKSIEYYLSEAHLRQMESKGFGIRRLEEMLTATSSRKSLVKLDDGATRVEIEAD